MKTKHCKQCGGTMNPLTTYSNQQYCSEVCRRRAHVQHQLRYLEKSRYKTQYKLGKEVIYLVYQGLRENKTDSRIIEDIIDKYYLRKYNKSRKIKEA